MRGTLRTTTTLTLLAALLAAASLPGGARAQVTTSTSSTTSTTVVSASTTTSTTSSTSSTTVPPSLQCKNRLLNRAKALGQRLGRCEARARTRARKGRPFDVAACIATGIARYDRTTLASPSFARGCLACTLAAVPPVRDGLLALHAELEARIACAPEIPLAERAKCEAKLHKAAAGFQAALMRCRSEAARLALAGGTPAEQQCVADARARFDRKADRLSCPPCVDADRIAAEAFEETDDLIGLAHCPCRFGDPGACAECRECSLADGCVPADEGATCGRNGCVAETCVGGTCTPGVAVACTDGDVCTVDRCVEDENPGCEGDECCVHDPLCDPDTLDPCVTECSCDPSQGCSCRCEPGCEYPGCVIFTP